RSPTTASGSRNRESPRATATDSRTSASACAASAAQSRSQPPPPREPGFWCVPPSREGRAFPHDDVLAAAARWEQHGAPGRLEMKDEEPIRIAVVEDKRRTREGLGAILDGTTGFRCVGLYPSVEAALPALENSPAHVLLLDIHLPGMS